MSDSDSENSCQYGSCHVTTFSDFYSPVHKPVTIAICIFGTFANSMNIVVLSRKYMRTPTNILLTGLSVAQLLLVSNYTALQLFEMCREACCSGAVWAPTGAWYMYINVNLNVVFHTVALTHTVVLSIFRYASIRWPTKMRAALQYQQPWRWSLVIFALVPFLCIPVYLSARVGLIEDVNRTCTAEVYDLVWAADDPAMISAVFWVFGIVFKFIPCILILVFSGLLILSIRDANIRKQRLMHGVAYSPSPKGSSTYHVANCADPGSRTPSACSFASSGHRGSGVVRSRTTRMLVAVALLCFLVEFAHGILNLLTAIYGTDFGENVYNQLGDLFEMLTLLYSSINFVLYCAMNTDFLRSFTKIFCPKSLRKVLLRNSLTTSKKRSYRPDSKQKGISNPLVTNRQMNMGMGGHQLLVPPVDPELSGVGLTVFDRDDAKPKPEDFEL